MIKAYEIFPGKTGNDSSFLPLWMHLEDTATVMTYLCKKRVSHSVISATGLGEDAFCHVCEFAARVHDIGKCTPAFASKILPHIPQWQERLESCELIVPKQNEFKSVSISHALAGEILLRNFGCPDGICSVVGAHHGKPAAESDQTFNYQSHIEAYYEQYYAKQRNLWQNMQSFILNDALERSGFQGKDELPTLSNCAQMILTGLLIEADWIASNQDYFPTITDEDVREKDIYPQRTNIALKRLNLTEPWHAWIQEKNSADFFVDRFGFKPNPVQNAVMDIVNESSSISGLLIVEAQMGVGKTEAALAAAEILAEKSGCGGLFFGLPTQATSNGLFSRMSQWAEHASHDGTHAIRLVHGMAELNEDYRAFFPKAVVEEDQNQKESSLTVHSWFSGNKQALLADFVVGTIDTALMAALRQKHVMLRQLGLCGKVVVIDECHAYDAYMSRFLIRLLQWLGAYQVPVILLSATLPENKKRELVEAYCVPFTKRGMGIALPKLTGYPLLTWANSKGVRAFPVKMENAGTTVKIQSLAEERIADSLEAFLKEGGCAGIIVNTVKRAQEIAEMLRLHFSNKKICVYHAQYLAEERICREKELMTTIGKGSREEQRNNVIVVGTQVLEQSLDIDFDYLITDLCPMDLLLQRMGRLHRHQRIRPNPVAVPTCSVLQTEGELDKGSAIIYGKWLLNQTKRYLPECVALPEDIPNLVNSVYAMPEDEYANDSAWQEFRDRTEIEESKASDCCLPAPKASKRETGNSIVGMLDEYIESEKKAEASVRDGVASIDVLVMCARDQDHAGFFPWIDGTLLRYDAIPSQEEARKIVLQKLRLPFVFGIGKNLDRVIETLEKENLNLMPLWQNSPWLKGELILLMDENGQRDLCGYHLCYEKENGLRYERIGE